MNKKAMFRAALYAAETAYAANDRMAYYRAMRDVWKFICDGASAPSQRIALEKELSVLKSDSVFMTESQNESAMADLCRRYGMEFVANTISATGWTF